MSVASSNSTAHDPPFPSVEGLASCSFYHATKGPTPPSVTCPYCSSKPRGWGCDMGEGHTHVLLESCCSPMQGVMLVDRCPASGLPTLFRDKFLMLRAHLLSHTSGPWDLMVPPYQCWQQALTHLYFVILFRNYQMSDVVWQTITKKAFFNQPPLLPNILF